MCNKFYWLAAAGILLGATRGSDAALLLSGNVTAYDAPGPVPVMVPATGATYSWLAGSNAGAVGLDPQLIKMTDGYSDVYGGDASVNGTWDSNVPYTAVFDLKMAYQVEQVVVSSAFQSGDGGATFYGGTGMITVWTSIDGIQFGDAWGQLINPTPVLDRNVPLSVSAAPVAAQYVRIEVSNVGTGEVRYYHAVTGEMEIFGDAVPEPLSLGLLTLGAAVLAVRRRR